MKTRKWLMGCCIALAAVLLAPIWPFVKRAPETEVARGPEPASASPSYPFSAQDLFFTEPYTYLEPTVRDGLGMCLDLDYVFIRFPYGFINTIDPREPPLKFGKRLVVNDEQALQRIHRESGFQVGDEVTVISPAGGVYPARIQGFSYVGNSASTVIVAADLELTDKDPDPSLFAGHGIALRGAPPVKSGAAKARPPLKPKDKLAERLVADCAQGPKSEWVIEGPAVVPAELDESGALYYFASFWRRPAEGYEIDDIELVTCIFKSEGEGFVKAIPPFPFRMIQVYDLDGDGRGEIFAAAGNAFELCHIYLVPEGASYRTLRRGLCSGY